MTDVVRMGRAPQERAPRRGLVTPRLRELEVERLDVTGRVPEGLRGHLVHIGPGSGTSDQADRALAMVHAVRIGADRADYVSRWLVGGDAAAKYSGVIAYSGSLHALGARGLPIRLDDALDPVVDARIPWGAGAHVHVDPVWDDLLAVESMVAESRLVVTTVDLRGRVQRVAEVPTDAPVQVHDFAFTDQFVVVIASGAVETDDATMWDPTTVARIGLIPRDGDASGTRWYDATPRVVWHFMNAYEADGEVVIDHIAHRQPIVGEAGATALPGATAPVLMRTVVTPVTGEVRDEVLDDHAVEFPAIDTRRAGLRHRIAYAALASSRFVDHRGEFDGIVRYDLRNGAVTDHVFPAPTTVSQPVVARRAGGTGEDDAWVLTIATDAPARTSRVAVFDPRTFERGPVAEVMLPQVLPAGDHVIWVPDAD